MFNIARINAGGSKMEGGNIAIKVHFRNAKRNDYFSSFLYHSILMVTFNIPLHFFFDERATTVTPIMYSLAPSNPRFVLP